MQENAALGTWLLAVVRDLRNRLPLGPGSRPPGNPCDPTWLEEVLRAGTPHYGTRITQDSR
jgi:hypothetical protein